MEVLRFSSGEERPPMQAAGDSADSGRALTDPGQPVFYYDLGDTWCYLAAERVMSELPVVPEWEPVWSGDPAGRPSGSAERQQFERRADELGLQPIRWPAHWPPESHQAMLAATYAKRIGRTVAFSLAAFRQAFAGGRDLGDRDTILIAGAACEIHPSALVKALSMESVAAGLEAAGARARRAGIRALPAIQVGHAVFEGEGLLERAAAALMSGSPR